jgi:hypothetical protein
MTAFHPELPGTDLIAAGLADLAQGIESEPALLVSIGAPRLTALGIPVERPFPEPERRLYERLHDTHPDSAHSRYNALIRHLVSLEIAPVCGLSTNRDRILRLMAALAAVARTRTRVYFSGGATAVLLGLRYMAIDAEVDLVPRDDVLLGALAGLKYSCELTVRLGSPAAFIPVTSGWARRSPLIERRGRVSFHHFDLYAQALAKVERGDAEDVADVGELLRRGLIDRARALQYFRRIEPHLYRYPVIDPPTFRRAVQAAFGSN